MTHDLRLAGGSVYLDESGPTPVDILIDNGRISGLIGREVEVTAREIVQLDGLLVLPGGIDPHVHLGKDIRVPAEPEDALLETASAASGGVTSMLVYLMSADSYHEVAPRAQHVMEQHSHSDFGFHFCLGSANHADEIPDYVRRLGVSSFKFFMNFRGEEGAYLGLPGNDDGYMLDLLTSAADSGAMINPHPENIELVWRLRQQPIDESRGPLSAWNQSRPAMVEAEAIQRVAFMAQMTGASVYAVHTSSRLAMEAMQRQRFIYDNLFVETCPHYLTLTTASNVGTYGKVNPPLRESEDLEALWAAIATGQVDTVGSDHNARHRSSKEKDIWSASAGFPGTGGLFPITLAEGLRRDVPLSRLVELTSTRAAKLFGLYPRKGTIRIGSDADVAVVDLNATTTIGAETQHSAAAYTPWEGWELPLRVVHTIVRGHFALRDGVLSTQPTGTYLSRPHSGAAALAALEGATCV